VLIASALGATTVMTGGAAYAALSGIAESRGDHIGQLHPSATQPTTTTVVVDQATGVVTTAQLATGRAASSASATASTEEREYEKVDKDD